MCWPVHFGIPFILWEINFYHVWWNRKAMESIAWCLHSLMIANFESFLIEDWDGRRWHFMLQTLNTLVCTGVLWVVFIHVIFENTKLFVVSCVSDSLLGNWTVVASISNVRHYPSRNNWNFTSVLTIPH